MTVKLITDGVADLPPRVVAEMGATVIPLNVRFGTSVYRDDIDLAVSSSTISWDTAKSYRLFQCHHRQPSLRRMISGSKTTPVIGTHTVPGLLLVAVRGDRG